MGRGGGSRSGGGGGWGGGKTSSVSAKSSTKSKPAAKPPAPAAAPAPAPAPAPTQSMMGSFSSTLGNLRTSFTDGIGWGAGSSIGRRAVDGIIGPQTINVEEIHSAPASAVSDGLASACGIHAKTLGDCLNSNASDISKCQFYMDMITECRRNSGVTEKSDQAFVI